MLISLGTAVSLISEWIPFLNLPFGGTVTLASLLPLILISYLYGIRWGLGSGTVFALLQLAIGFRTVSGLFLPDSDSYMGSVFAAFSILLMDYLLAYTVVGLGGIFRSHPSRAKALVFGTLLSMALCYSFHVLSGVIFYGAWAEWFFTESAAKDFFFSSVIMEHFSGFGLSLLYSLIYNAMYMIPETLITVFAAVAVSKISVFKKM